MSGDYGCDERATMTVFLRCDAGGMYGLGHVRRCQRVAEALQAAGAASLCFVTTTPSSLQACLVKSERWQIAGGVTEADCTAWVKEHSHAGDVLLVDTPSTWEGAASLAQLRAEQRLRVVRLDAPWADQDSCDLLVLPGMHHSGTLLDQLDLSFGERLLTGGDYVLLPSSCGGVPRRVPWRAREPRLVMSAGGSDPGQVLPRLYEMTTATLRTALGERATRVYLLGEQAQPWVLSTVPTREEWFTGFTLSAIASAQALVTLWGATVYEALSAGTPTLTLARTEAEANDAACLEAATDGAVQSLGTVTALMRETLCARIMELWDTPKALRHMHQASEGLIDGHGGVRLAQAILALPSAWRTA